MTLFQGGTVAEWPPGTVHDSVAAIARDAAYHRSVTDSLWAAFWRWLTDWYNAFVDSFRGSAPGRTVVITLMVLLGLLVVARVYLAAKAAREDAAHSGGRGARASVNFWADAQRLAAQGQFTDAAHALLGAMLVAFATRGEVRLHSSKTAGDYARELRRRGSQSHGRFESFRRRYDVAIYGRGACTAEEYAALLEDARPIIQQARAA